MQRRSDDTLIPILGWTGPNGRHATVWRFGVFMGGNTLFGVGEINADRTSLTQAVMNLTSDQIRDWRLLLRDSAGKTFAISFPTAMVDATEPYQWSVPGLEAFLRTARMADRTVDVMIVDSASAWIEYPHRAVNYFETHYDSGRLVLSGGLPRLTVGTTPTQYLGFWDTSITNPVDKGILYRQSLLQADGSGQTATMVNGVRRWGASERNDLRVPKRGRIGGGSGRGGGVLVSSEHGRFGCLGVRRLDFREQPDDLRGAHFWIPDRARREPDGWIHVRFLRPDYGERSDHRARGHNRDDMAADRCGFGAVDGDGQFGQGCRPAHVR